ncbi:MAG: NDP-sugar synthase [Actinomycetota bacterium]|nr:NDP-sugar synthase [Actinomycetota bacterium]
MKAMVLAAGKGTRLFPLTGVIPKPMAPVADKPIIQHIFELLARTGVDETHVNVHYLADVILDHYGEETEVGGMDVSFHREERLMGTAGGVKNAAGTAGFDDTFVVVMGDALTDVDIREVVAFHKEKEATATLALTPVEDTTEYGVAVLDGKKRVVGFQEKPSPSEAISNLANTGIYVFEPRALDYVPEGAFFDFAKDLFPALLAAGERVAGYDAGGFYWSDIGTLSAYKQAQSDVLAGLVKVEVDGERWGKDLWVGERARIHPSAYGHMEGPAFVGAGAEVGPGASFSGGVTIGRRCQVGGGATVKGSVLLPGAEVGRGAYLEDCIIGPGYEIGPGERLLGEALMRAPASPCP